MIHPKPTPTRNAAAADSSGTEALTATITNTVTPRIALANTKPPRKVMCRGLTPKNKNIEANTHTLLTAMQRSPPFAPAGGKRRAWGKVADLCRSNPDLENVTGTLCENRYVMVRDQYRAAQAAAIKATGISENVPTEQDVIIEHLIAREDESMKMQEERKQAYSRLMMEQSREQAIVQDEREEIVYEISNTPSRASSSRNVHTPAGPVAQDPIPARRKRRRDKFDRTEDTLDEISQLYKRVLKKMLGED